MIRVTLKHIIQLIESVDKTNFRDFESLEKLFIERFNNVQIDMLKNIIDLFMFEYNVYCDADLNKISSKNIKEMAVNINKLAKDYNVYMK